MKNSMGSLISSGVQGVRDGADAVSHTMGDVFDDLMVRVDDLVDVAHPRKAAVARRRRGGLLVIVVAIAGVVLVWKLMSRTSTAGGSGSSPSGGPATNVRAGSPGTPSNDRHQPTVNETADSSTSSTPPATSTTAKSAKPGKSATAAEPPAYSTD